MIECSPIIKNEKCDLSKHWNHIGSWDIAHLQKIECSPIIKNEKSYLSKHWYQTSLLKFRVFFSRRLYLLICRRSKVVE
jgi:hypothetical protein